MQLIFPYTQKHTRTHSPVFFLLFSLTPCLQEEEAEQGGKAEILRTGERSQAFLFHFCLRKHFFFSLTVYWDDRVLYEASEAAEGNSPFLFSL